MTRHIASMPGVRCRFHVQGRCLYEERLNPGLNESWRCRVLAAWEEEYERFLTQAETFNLDIGAGAGVWSSRFRKMLRARRPCPNFEAAPCLACPQGAVIEDEDAAVACVHVLGGLCLLALPACPGLCSREKELRLAERSHGKKKLKR